MLESLSLIISVLILSIELNLLRLCLNPNYNLAKRFVVSGLGIFNALFICFFINNFIPAVWFFNLPKFLNYNFSYFFAFAMLVICVAKVISFKILSRSAFSALLNLSDVFGYDSLDISSAAF